MHELLANNVEEVAQVRHAVDESGALHVKHVDEQFGEHVVPDNV